jgi:signal peptidase II
LEENLKRYLKDYSFLVLIAGLIIAADQLSKAWIRTNLAVGETYAPLNWMEPYARIVHWYNTGVAFGMFQGQNVVFIILSSIVSLAIIYYFHKVSWKDWPIKLALSLQVGGAVGNNIDRITVGHVTDFISVGNFPVWNIADASITIGVVFLLLGVWLQERNEKKQAQINSEEPADPSQQNGEPLHCE